MKPWKMGTNIPHMKDYFAIASYQFRKDVKINILKGIYFVFFVLPTGGQTKQT